LYDRYIKYSDLLSDKCWFKTNNYKCNIRNLSNHRRKKIIFKQNISTFYEKYLDTYVNYCYIYLFKYFVKEIYHNFSKKSIQKYNSSVNIDYITNKINIEYGFPIDYIKYSINKIINNNSKYLIYRNDDIGYLSSINNELLYISLKYNDILLPKYYYNNIFPKINCYKLQWESFTDINKYINEILLNHKKEIELNKGIFTLIRKKVNNISDKDLNKIFYDYFLDRNHISKLPIKNKLILNKDKVSNPNLLLSIKKYEEHDKYVSKLESENNIYNKIIGGITKTNKKGFKILVQNKKRSKTLGKKVLHKGTKGKICEQIARKDEKKIILK